jgi:hypothetical protein
VISAIRAAVRETGRVIEDDHYGAGFPFRFGRRDDPPVARAADAYGKRTGHDPFDYVAVGDAAAILERVAAYLAAGATKFILRPLAEGAEDMLAQTRLLMDEVLSEVARRWPRPS